MNWPPELEPISSDDLIKIRSILSRNTEEIQPSRLISLYRDQALGIVLNPEDPSIAERICESLRTRQPLSVVRIGDGEANLWGVGSSFLPIEVELTLAKAIVLQQADRFNPTETWLHKLSDLMGDAIKNADIVGIVGFWHPNVPGRLPDLFFSNRVNSTARGLIGQWQARTLGADFARKGHFKNKLIAPGHLYVSVIRHLSEIINSADRVVLVTSVEGITPKLRGYFSGKEIDMIRVGGGAANHDSEPTFLTEFPDQLAADLTGALFLVGAGPWSELYCNWIKINGGVAIDIGSGLDLMMGRRIRPLHGVLEFDYSLDNLLSL